ncbi:hypothetical protein RN001_002879 [Aquatica leii]|uniref:Equilibrative nucleoside transporter 3 n=1 Tax=Aquatica leii TaxID=1421715 RepID=A0AAN7QNS0_9COLE|nr:hypothetical protein RN001_002879 [Aquatica leii]
MERTNNKPLLDPISSDTDEDEIRIDNAINEDHIIVVKDEEPLFKAQEPKDKYLVAFFIFYFLGMTTLIPWNFFITAHDYWMFKFRDPNNHLNFFLPPPKRTSLQTNFTSYISIASNVPGTIFLMLNVVLNKRILLNTRMITSFLLMLFLFIVTTAFVKINTDDWQEQFFIITITIIVLLNVTSAILSGSIFGIIGKFSPKYITAVVSGQALGAIFTALVQIIALSFEVSSIFSAFIYFLVGDIIILIAIILYLILIKTVFFKYHISDKMGVGLNDFQNELVRPQLISYKAIMKKIWPYALSTFFVFFITLSLFPGVTVLVESEGKGHGNKWNDIYFVPVISYLLFNCGDYSGRVLAGLLHWPRKASLQLVFSIIRIALIPLLLLCNVQPRQNFPVIFNHDYYYIIIVLLISLSNGYIANLNMMCAPRVVKQHEREMASSIMAVFLGLGLTAGSGLSLIFIKFV